jgi:ParB family chromosome partitioning protein
MEKKALGRGLSALISSGRGLEDVLKREVSLASPSTTTTASDENSILFLPLDRICANKFQPRTSFNEEQLKELSDSIREKGVLEPVLVRRSGDRYELIAGERRLRAAQILKLAKIPAVVRDVSDREALVLSIVENIQREELNPMEESHAFDRLMKEFKLTQEEVARAVSKDRSTVANILRLLNLPAEVQKAIASGQLSFGHGKVLLGLDSIPQQIRLTQMVMSNSLSVRELETYIGSHKLASSKKTRVPKDMDPHVIDLEKRLQHSLGTRVKIIDHKKRGKIQIDYYSIADRERILKFLLTRV